MIINLKCNKKNSNNKTETNFKLILKNYQICVTSIVFLLVVFEMKLFLLEYNICKFFETSDIALYLRTKMKLFFFFIFFSLQILVLAFSSMQASLVWEATRMKTTHPLHRSAHQIKQNLKDILLYFMYI